MFFDTKRSNCLGFSFYVLKINAVNLQRRELIHATELKVEFSLYAVKIFEMAIFATRFIQFLLL